MILEAEITPGMAVAEAVELARVVEQAGFDRLGVSDVALQPDVFVVMAACAASTERVLIGPMVTNPYTRHPAQLAAAMATIHELSSGRAFLGIGTGAGLEPLGITYPRPALTLREALVVIRSLFAGERVSFCGETVTVEGAALLRPPATPIPVSVGTRSRQVMGVAGELADIALVGARYLSPTLAATYRSWLAEGAARAGRDPSTIEVAPRMTLCVSHDGALAKRSVKRYVAHYLGLVRPDDLHVDDERLERIAGALQHARGWYFDHDRYDPPELDELVTDEMVERFAIAGTPDECIAHVERLAAMGFTSVSMNLAAVRRPGATSPAEGLRETVEAFAEVLPACRAALRRP